MASESKRLQAEIVKQAGKVAPKIVTQIRKGNLEAALSLLIESKLKPQDIFPFIQVEILTEILTQVAKQPKQAAFGHQLFLMLLGLVAPHKEDEKQRAQNAVDAKKTTITDLILKTAQTVEFLSIKKSPYATQFNELGNNLLLTITKPDLGSGAKAAQLIPLKGPLSLQNKQFLQFATYFSTLTITNPANVEPSRALFSTFFKQHADNEALILRAIKNVRDQEDRHLVFPDIADGRFVTLAATAGHTEQLLPELGKSILGEPVYRQIKPDDYRHVLFEVLGAKQPASMRYLLQDHQATGLSVNLNTRRSVHNVSIFHEALNPSADFATVEALILAAAAKQERADAKTQQRALSSSSPARGKEEAKVRIFRDDPDRQGKVLMHHACTVGSNPKVVLLLLQNGFGTLSGPKDDNESTPLEMLFSTGHEALLDELLAKMPQALTGTDENGLSAMDYATEYHMNKMITKLETLPDAKAGAKGSFPLSAATPSTSGQPPSASTQRPPSSSLSSSASSPAASTPAPSSSRSPAAAPPLAPPPSSSTFGSSSSSGPTANGNKPAVGSAGTPPQSSGGMGAGGKPAK